MTHSGTDPRATLIAELNDLLQLDHDAVQAYTLAIENLRDEAHRESLIRYRGDHQRHVEDLSRMIRERGGEPLELPHLPTGPLKLAVQAAGAVGGDRAVLLAFRSNERQVRDKYVRHARGEHEPAVAELLRRNAEDEERHYAWVAEVLERMGVGEDTVVGAAANLFEAVHARTADLVEGAGRKIQEVAEQNRRDRS